MIEIYGIALRTGQCKHNIKQILNYLLTSDDPQLSPVDQIAITVISENTTVKELVECKEKKDRDQLFMKYKKFLPIYMKMSDKEKSNMEKLKSLKNKLITTDGDTSEIQEAVDALSEATQSVRAKIQEAEQKIEVCLAKIVGEFLWVESMLTERYVKAKFLKDLKIFYKVTIPALVYF